MVAMPPRPADPKPWFRTDGLVGGLVVATIAAIAATVIWYAVVANTSYQIGIIATLVGWVIGSGAVLGARGRGSLWLVVASVALTLVALFLSEYLIAYHVATAELGLEFSLIQDPLLIIELVIEIVASDPVTLLFWGFAVVAAAYVPFKAIGAAPTGPTLTASPTADNHQAAGR